MATVFRGEGKDMSVSLNESSAACLEYVSDADAKKMKASIHLSGSAMADENGIVKNCWKSGAVVATPDSLDNSLLW
jgi:hypothetical protein